MKPAHKRLAVSAAAAVLLASPATAQAPAAPSQAPTSYACPQGWMCSPPGAPPPTVAPRPITQEEIDRTRRSMAGEAAGSILRPEDIAGIRDAALAAQGAANFPGYSGDVLPEPQPRIIEIKDATTTSPPRITLMVGIVTPVSFFDKGGRPWPIVGVSYDPRAIAADGNCGDAGRTPPQAVEGEGRPTTITLMPCRLQTFANIMVRLEGLGAPIILMAVSGDRSGKVDLPVTVKVIRSSPTTKEKEEISQAERAARNLRRAYTSAPAVPPGVDPELDAFLAEVPPKGAESLTTDMAGVSAWMYRGKLFVRGPVTVLSPAYDAMGAGSNGQFVWRFNAPFPRLRVVTETETERAIVIGL